jgi:hypothetical protein
LILILRQDHPVNEENQEIILNTANGTGSGKPVDKAEIQAKTYNMAAVCL